MADPSKTPAAELVAWYEEKAKAYEVHQYLGGKAECPFNELPDIPEVSKELDRRCEAAGIKLQNTGFEFHRITSWQMDHATMTRPVAVFVDNATELHALLGWLLMKGGTGK